MCITVGYWRIRTNHELQVLYKDPDIVADIKTRRLQWLGHMIRMDDNRLIKRVLDVQTRRKENDRKTKIEMVGGR